MRTVLGLLLAISVACGACGEDEGASAGPSEPQIVVTTSILGDVVQELVGDDAQVEVLMPPGSDPHSFAPSAQQAEALRAADVVVVNGLDFEAGLVDTIEAAEADGVEVVAAIDGVDVLAFAEDDEEEDHAHDEEAGEEADQDDEAGEDPHGHDAEGADPHFFADPARMREAAEHIAAELARSVDGLDTPDHDERVDAYLAELDALDAEVASLLVDIPDERRTLVTNHEVFGYFADRYGFHVLGVVIPGGSTLAEPSAADLDELAHLIDEEGVPAIFAETSSPARLAESLAAEGADVAVVELYTESLGEPGSDGETYLELVRTNAVRIAAALT